MCVLILLPLRFGWLLVPRLYKDIYLDFLSVCPFEYTAVEGSGKLWSVKCIRFDLHCVVDLKIKSIYLTPIIIKVWIINGQ